MKTTLTLTDCISNLGWIFEFPGYWQKELSSGDIVIVGEAQIGFYNCCEDIPDSPEYTTSAFNPNYLLIPTELKEEIKLCIEQLYSSFTVRYGELDCPDGVRIQHTFKQDLKIDLNLGWFGEDEAGHSKLNGLAELVGNYLNEHMLK